MAEHACRFVPTIVWREAQGPLAAALGVRVFRCQECGGERKTVRPPPAVLKRARAAAPGPPPLADEHGAARRVAHELLRGERSGARSGRGFLGKLRAAGLPDSVTGQWLESFLKAGWIELEWSLRPGREELRFIQVLDVRALDDFARPGERREREAALGEARASARDGHPVVREIAAFLGSARALRERPPVLRALGALAEHVAAGDVVAERVFSAQRLGDSKALARVRRRVEGIVGPLEALGIREGDRLVLVGGHGEVHLEGERLVLGRIGPFIGLSRDAVSRGARISPPDQGVLAVENLAAFEACCRGEVDGAVGSLVVWSAGYPGRAVRSIVGAAIEGGAPLRAWADLDLDGVRIARLIAGWAGCATFFRMGPEELDRARGHRPLSPASLRAIDRELQERPAAPLSEPLRALRARGVWVEQEALLGR